MDNSIQINGKQVLVFLSHSAEKALAQRSTPLLAEMELYFSCLIRKAVRFYDAINGDAVLVNDNFAVRFRPVMTQKCKVEKDGSAPPLTDFPIENGNRYIPHWLKIDYKKGEWLGEFGYTDNA